MSHTHAWQHRGSASATRNLISTHSCPNTTERERESERERGEPSGGLGQAGAPHSEGCILSSPLSILPHSVILLLLLFSLFFSPGTSSPSLLIPQSAVQSWANHWGIWDLAQGGGCRDT